jgi:hypothetical protein
MLLLLLHLMLLLLLHLEEQLGEDGEAGGPTRRNVWTNP